jgi:hypothetical protein
VTAVPGNVEVHPPVDPGELRLTALLVKIPELAASDLGDIAVGQLLDPRLSAPAERLVSLARDRLRISPYTVARALRDSTPFMRLRICTAALEVQPGLRPDVTLAESFGSLRRLPLSVRNCPVSGGPS